MKPTKFKNENTKIAEAVLPLIIFLIMLLTYIAYAYVVFSVYFFNGANTLAFASALLGLSMLYSTCFVVNKLSQLNVGGRYAFFTNKIYVLVINFVFIPVLIGQLLRYGQIHEEPCPDLELFDVVLYALIAVNVLIVTISLFLGLIAPRRLGFNDRENVFAAFCFIIMFYAVTAGLSFILIDEFKMASIDCTGLYEKIF